MIAVHRQWGELGREWRRRNPLWTPDLGPDAMDAWEASIPPEAFRLPG